MKANRIIAGFTVGLCALAGLTLRAPAQTNPPGPDIRRDATVTAIERAMPSVVNIATAMLVERNDPEYRWYRSWYGDRIQRQFGEEPAASGSGVIIDEDGYIISNIHVIRGASRIQVKLSDGRVYEAQSLVGIPNSDVVLLKIIAKPGETFSAIKLAKDDDLMLGETVIAIGNPFGLEGSVARGILSSKSRRQPDPNRQLSFENWLQTDAAINPGNSGGALINLRGDLIGVNVAVYNMEEKQGMGVGFAIPVKQISAAITEFFTPEELPIEGLTPLWFGAKFRSAPYPLAVSEVRPRTPADAAGLKPGQTISEINGKRPKSPMDCAEILLKSPKGLATFAVMQEGVRKEIKVQMLPFAGIFKSKLGLDLEKLTTADVDRFGVKPGDGVMVSAVEPGSPAEKAGLRQGILLHRLNDEPVVDLSAAASALQNRQSSETIRATVRVLERNVFGYFTWRSATVPLKVR
jgi:S1-C subfamily serine protease